MDIIYSVDSYYNISVQQFTLLPGKLIGHFLEEGLRVDMSLNPPAPMVLNPDCTLKRLSLSQYPPPNPSASLRNESL